MLICAEMFAISSENDEMNIDESTGDSDSDVAAKAMATSFHVNQIKRNIDEIDGLNPSNSSETVESHNQNVNVDEKEKSGKRVTFRKEVVTVIHNLERWKVEEKKKMFYTSKDLTTFRIQYIIELQELQSRVERQNGSMFRTITAKFHEILTCKPLIDKFCSDRNRASI